MKKLLVFFVFMAIAGANVYGQDIAVKTNLFYGASTLTPNIAVEFALAPNMTIDFSGGYNPWNWRGTAESNKKAVHYMIQPEYRYWFTGKFNGHFIGGHILFSQYNVGGHNLPLFFGKGSNDYRHEGWMAGAGISYGYQFILSDHWSIEANVGEGYARMKYDRYDCILCGDKLEGEKIAKNYFGPTKAGISVIYIIR